MKILMVGPDYKTVKGGMTTVVKSYFSEKFLEVTNLVFIPTHKDGCRIFKLIVALKGYIQIVFEKNVDIIHINMAARGSFYRKSIVVFLANMMKKKCIIHLHGGAFTSFYENESNILMKKYIRIVFNRADLILALSNEWVNILKGYGIKSNIRVLSNGIEIPNTNYYDTKNKNILFMGKICDEKGIYDLLLAVKELKKDIEDLKLIIAGFGEIDKMNKLIDEYEIRKNVEYIGWIDKKAKIGILKETKLFILPSYYEAMPMSILESMSYGIPCISTKIGGIPTLIDDKKNGILIDRGDIKSLVDTIKLLFKDDNTRLKYSENAYNKCVNKFNVESVNSQLINYYRELLSY